MSETHLRHRFTLNHQVCVLQLLLPWLQPVYCSYTLWRSVHLINNRQKAPLHTGDTVGCFNTHAYTHVMQRMQTGERIGFYFFLLYIFLLYIVCVGMQVGAYYGQNVVWQSSPLHQLKQHHVVFLLKHFKIISTIQFYPWHWQRLSAGLPYD